MELPIDKLLEKYWNGETTLEEEKMIKSHFQSNPSLANEGSYFRYLSKEKSVGYVKAKSGFSKRWISIAATVLVGVCTAVLAIRDSQKDPFAIEDPKEAFKATKEALLLISSELNEGQHHTMELVKINKAKEELKTDS